MLSSAKTWLVFFVLSLCLAGMASAAGTSEPEVWAAENARIDALMKQDYDALEKILADDLLYCHASGRVDSKAAFMQTLRNGQTRYIRMEKKNATIRSSSEMAVINGSYWVQTKGPSGSPERPVEDAVLTLIYAKRNGQWQIISYQSTRKPAANPVPVGGPSSK